MLAKRKKILIVEDEATWQRRIKRALDHDYDVRLADSVSDAIRIINSQEDIDLVLTDVALPDDGGKQFLELLSQTEKHNLPVVVLSGYTSTVENELSGQGIDAFLEKATFSEKTLLSTIKTAFIKHEPKQPQHLESPVLTRKELELFLDQRINRILDLQQHTLLIPSGGQFELIKPLRGYKEEIDEQLERFPYEKNVFLMMKFRDSSQDLGEFIIETLSNNGLRGVKANHDDWEIITDAYNPIAILYCCKYGIALFDEPEEHQAYSPNVAYELGMMHYQNKQCLILRHQTLPEMPFDLLKNLYVTQQFPVKNLRGVEGKEELT